MTIARVQGSVFQESASGSSIQAASLTLTAGNCLVAFVTWGDADLTFVTGAPAAGQYRVSDGVNTYAELTHVWNTNIGQGSAVVVALNVAAGATAPTLSFNGATSFIGIGTTEFSGVKTSAATDVSWTANVAANGATISAGTQTVTAGSLVLGCGTYDLIGGQTSTPGSGFNEEFDDTTNTGLYAEYQITVSGGSIDVGYTRSGATGAIAVDGVALLAGAGGGGGGTVVSPYFFRRSRASAA